MLASEVHRKLFTGLFWLLLLLSGHLVSGQDGNTCSSDELNHSKLVVCDEKSSDCNSGTSPEWPSSASEILLLQSTRSGDRLRPKILDNLMLKEDENTRLLNINTTVYVYTNQHQDKKLGEVIFGHGATFDLSSFSDSSRDDGRRLAPILEDLFGKTSSSLNLNILRLVVSQPHHDQAPDIRNALLRLDNEIAKFHHSKPILVLLDLAGDFGDYSESITEILSATYTLSTMKWITVAIDGLNLMKDVEDIRRLIPRDPRLSLLLSESARSLIEQDKSDLDNPNGSKFDGVLLRWEKSVPYNILDSFRPWKTLLTVNSHLPITREYGDWQNARNFAVELLNLLKYGSSGIIQGATFGEALSNDLGGDCSIYSVRKEHGIHFRSPIYYAFSHFSRYIGPGSRLLPMDVFTQPNMFAANYAAFMTDDSQHVVAIVLNDNEHLLPFRLALDDVVMAHAFLEPKSFNTLIIKRQK